MHELPKSFVNLKKLVHLNLSDCSVRITAEAFWGLTSIQHLNLSCRSKDFPESTGFEGMQEVISNLIELRYLDLSGYSWRANWTLQPDEILSFVDRICTLTNLEHLDLSRNVQLVSFPERIGSLRKLRRLDLSGCSKLVTLPECMRKMDSLKFINVTSCFHLDMSMVPQYKFASLPHFVVLADYFESTSSNIGLLRHENPNILHISRLENVMSAEEVYRIKLSEKAMKSLTLEWTVDYWRSMEDMEVLGMLVPPNTLKYFELRGYSSVSFPTWVMGIELYLANLTKVVLWELHKCISLPPLGQLPRLGELVIGRMDSITTIEEGFCSAGPGAFRQLMRFHLRQMENLEVWNTTYYVQDDVQEFMFPNLEELLICDCPKLRLKPCAPATREWEIENSDNVLSSWDGEGEIDPDALLSPPQEKYREPGGSYRATPRVLKVKSSKVPFEQWRLFRHLLPTYTLSITCCTYLTSNSQEIIRELSSIKLLYLEDDAQPQLPKWLGELTSLERLGITKYLGLDAPLESMKQLTCLRYLWLSNCGSMPTLPQWLGELISLRRLTISDWRNLSDFPESMRRLTSLQEMRLEGCPRITALPEWLGDLASLNKLLINCEGIEYLPASIQKLTKLEKLTIYAPKLAQWCASLENKRKLAHIKKKVWDLPCNLLCIS
jgi:Leucine-rich repeat (LRR) protein